MFNFDQNADIAARDLLFTYRASTDPINLMEKIKHNCDRKQIYAFGSGPSLPGQVRNIADHISTQRNQFFIVAADGAANALMEQQIYPDFVVTDLDGLKKNKIEMLLAHSIPLLVHAHGDNLDRLRELESILRNEPNIIGTTQVTPKYPIINPGGFTDGDRGLYFLHLLLPLDLPFHLFGYDFGSLIGRYSKPEFTTDMPMTEMKRKKLTFSRELLENLQIGEHRKLIFHESGSANDF
jgi:uncharacterized Rossmann fold enzyme